MPFSNDAIIKVKDLVYSYDSVRALDGLTFEIYSGEFVGLVGPNGSGKTTLLRCLSKLYTPQEGSIELDGRDLRKLSPLEGARIYAVVPSEFSMDMNISITDTVLLGRYPYLGGIWWEKERDEEIALEAMEKLNVLNFGNRKLGELSSGEKQRVLIAKAMAQEAKVLLIDEPVAHLDLGYQMEIMEMLKSLARDGVTIIAAMHELNLAVKYCDKLIVLDKGRIVACGKPKDIVTQKLIEDVYGVKVIVQDIPEAGLVIIPLSSSNNGGVFDKKNGKKGTTALSKTPARRRSVEA
ncbi:MAG: ABC transporter ATP-binding protein [Candidatus Freyarchaeota archaeon]|nr:ABC transporter ATP-binding protein [Candidatus Jordarchaeia archaeon]MBS7281251.1 ABC transporter ATP-binding protein [Candidatus Jordarchaeia archaeon]